MINVNRYTQLDEFCRNMYLNNPIEFQLHRSRSQDRIFGWPSLV